MSNVAIFTIVGALAVAMNLLLIVLTMGMHNRKREIKYAVCLAVMDIAMPCLAFIFRGIAYLTGSNLLGNVSICAGIGAGFFISIFLSLMLVMLVAVERYRVVFSWRIPRWMCCSLCGYAVGFVSLVLFTASQGNFVLRKDARICIPDVRDGFYSQFAMFSFGFSLMFFLMATVLCYVRILFFVAATTFQDLEMSQLSDSARGPKAGLRLAPVAMRTTFICAIYFTLVAPACFVLMLLGLRAIEEAPLPNLVAAMSLFTLSLANPFLVIFAHSATFEKLVQLFSFKSFRRKQNLSYVDQS